MSQRSKREYLEAIYLRYKRSSRKQRKNGRTPLYRETAIMRPLKQIWLSANLPCSKRLKAVLPLWLPSHVQEYGKLAKGVTEALLRISPAAIERILKPVRARYKGRGGLP